MTDKFITHIEQHDQLSAVAELVCERVFFSDLDRYDAAYEIRHRLSQVMDENASVWFHLKGVDFVEVVEHFMDKIYENN